MNKPGDAFRKDYLAAAILLAGMAIISFMNILGRYLFHYSLAFTEEVTINLFVWMTVVGSGIAFERCGHLGMISLYNMFPVAGKKAVVILSAFLSAVLFVVVDILLIRTIYQEITIFQAKSSALGIPVWIYYAGVIVFSPVVFRGIYTGALRQLAGISPKEK